MVFKNDGIWQKWIEDWVYFGKIYFSLLRFCLIDFGFGNESTNVLKALFSWGYLTTGWQGPQSSVLTIIKVCFSLRNANPELMGLILEVSGEARTYFKFFSRAAGIVRSEQVQFGGEWLVKKGSKDCNPFLLSSWEIWKGVTQSNLVMIILLGWSSNKFISGIYQWKESTNRVIVHEICLSEYNGSVWDIYYKEI